MTPSEQYKKDLKDVTKRQMERDAKATLALLKNITKIEEKQHGNLR